MKRIVSILFAALFVAILSVNAYASGFVPSVTSKSAPALIPDKDGYVAFIKDSSGETFLSFKESDIIIVSYLERGKKAEIKNELEAAYAELVSGAPQKLLENQTAQANSGVKYEYVVSDLFSIEISPEWLAYLDKPTKIQDMLTDGKYLEVYFKTGLSSDEKAPDVLYKCEGEEWKIAESQNTGNGIISVKFTSLCPVAFLNAVDKSDSPQTSSKTTFVWIVLGLCVATIAATAVMVAIKKKR